MSEEKKAAPESGGKKKAPPVSAFDAALRYLSSSPRTEKETRDKLRAKGYSRADIDEAVRKLKMYRYIDDAKYAADFAEYNSGKLGRKKMLFKLVKMLFKLVTEKGVARETAENAVADAFSEDAELEAALAAAQKFVAAKRITERRELPKVGAFLYRRGYGREIADSVISGLSDSLSENGGDEF